MQILINCCNICLGEHMTAYLNKKPTKIAPTKPYHLEDFQIPVYTSELETCLEQMADRVKELCSIWDFKTGKAIFNDMMNYMQVIAMWNWALKMVYEKYPNKKDIEIVFTSAIRGGGDYFTRQHIKEAERQYK